MSNSKEEERAYKDMIIGMLWFLGGFILTVTETGAIFWGAMAYGIIKFIKGLSNKIAGV
jgi:hypothetical protein